MSDNLPILINRLFTCILLAFVLFACQNTPEGDRHNGVKIEYQN